MRINSRGQITIPKGIRRKTGLLPNTDAEFTFERGKVVLKPAGRRASPGRRAVERLPAR